MSAPPTNHIIAIDPGTDKSAIVQWDGETVQEAVILDNEQCREYLRKLFDKYNSVSAVQSEKGQENRDGIHSLTVAVEMIASYGMAVGKEVFETCLQIGRIQEIACERAIECQLVYRREVKMHLCGSMKAKDSNIRQALVDRFGPPGTLKNKGRLYGIKSHLWSALAIAVTVIDFESRTSTNGTRSGCSQ